MYVPKKLVHQADIDNFVSSERILPNSFTGICDETIIEDPTILNSVCWQSSEVNNQEKSTKKTERLFHFYHN